MSVRRWHNKKGEEQARRLREYIIKAVADKTGHSLPESQTLDQLVRTAAKYGVRISIRAWVEQ